MKGYTVSTIHEDYVEKRISISGPDDVNALVSEIFDPDKEHLYAVLLNTKNQVIQVHLVSVGTLNQNLVHPREVLKPAIVASAANIIVTHNHPTGDPHPSNEDIELTRRLNEACNVVGISLLDHVIVGNGTGRFYSLKESGVF